ncbi:MAG: RagB/SusD family nutrient uptake outer membrane protein [Ilyomonas sp.]
MKKFLYIILLTVFFFSVSCEKQVFESSPSDKYDENTVWTSMDLVEAFINETYNGVGNWVTDGLCLSSMVDDTYSMFNWAGGRSVAQIAMNATNSQILGVNYNKGGNYAPDRHALASGKWGYMYSKIRAANQFFNKIDDLNVPGEEEKIKQMKGEMHFLRAYFYSQLVNVYGEVILITDEYKITDDFLNVTKSSYQDITDYIVSECNLAIEMLPESFPAEPGRATKGAAMALKAEQLLYAASPLNNGGSYNSARLQEALGANEDILSLGIYSLYNPGDYRHIFLDKANPEIIFAKYTNGDLFIDRENDMERDRAPAGTGGFTSYCPLQNLVDEFEVINGNSTLIPATWNGTTRTVTNNPAYNDNDPYKNRDPRFYATILYNGAVRGKNGYIVDSYVGGKDSRQSTTTAYWNASWSSYYVRKFSNEASDAYGDDPRTDVMWIHYRLGEVYLNLAEILYELNTSDSNGRDAKWYVNQIRGRAAVPLLNSVDREAIRHERRIELAFEGNRFFDVRRWQIYDKALGKGCYGLKLEKQQNGTYITSLSPITNPEGKFDPRYYWWPIPENEIRKNPSLAQSPGW